MFRRSNVNKDDMKHHALLRLAAEATTAMNMLVAVAPEDVKRRFQEQLARVEGGKGVTVAITIDTLAVEVFAQGPARERVSLLTIGDQT